MNLLTSKQEAIDMGFTHEGRLYGVPVYLTEPTENHFFSCAKVEVLIFWIIFCDFLYDLAEQIIPEGKYLETPVKFGNKL